MYLLFNVQKSETTSISLARNSTFNVCTSRTLYVQCSPMASYVKPVNGPEMCDFLTPLFCGFDRRATYICKIL